MPGRQYSAGSGYRYAFNGKEADHEVSGNGNQYDYGFRIYNSRLGRFLSVDPLTQSFPWFTPFQFASNSPITSVDMDGLESVEVQVVAKHLYDPKLQHQAKSVGNNDKSALAAMQRTAWNQVLSDLDGIVASHFDPKKNTAITTSQWDGITGDVAKYLSSSNTSLSLWNSYENYDYDYATTDEIADIVDGTVQGLIENHFYASTSGTEFYYRYLNLVNQAKDPNQKAALIAERETLSKKRWSNIMSAAQLGFAEVFMVASGITGSASGNIGGKRFKLGFTAAEDSYTLLKLENGGYAPIYRAEPKSGELFALKQGEFRVIKNGNYPARGLSLNVSFDEASQFGTKVYRIKSIPDELRLIKTPSSKMPNHVDIIPKDVSITPEKFQELLNQIKFE